MTPSLTSFSSITGGSGNPSRGCSDELKMKLGEVASQTVADAEVVSRVLFVVLVGSTEVVSRVTVFVVLVGSTEGASVHSAAVGEVVLTVGGGGVGEVVLTVGGVEVWSSSRVEQRGAVEAGPMPALVLACMRTPYLVEGFRLVRT